MFTCFTGAKVQILTLLLLLEGARHILERDHPEIFVEVDETEHREGGGGVWDFLSSRGYLPGQRFGANLLFVPVTM